MCVCVCVCVCVCGGWRGEEGDDRRCNHTFMTLNLFLQVLIHYLGDEKTAQDFSHGNRKKNPERKYCQQCPSSRNKMAEQVVTTDPAKLYKTEIAAMDCHPALARVLKPRDIKQVY